MPVLRTTKGRFETQPDDGVISGDKTGAQKASEKPAYWQSFSSDPVLAGTVLWANGGTWDNPFGFPGYANLYGRTFETYRWMLQHPILQLVRSISVGPTLASTWNFEKESDKDGDEFVELVARQLLPIRRRILADFFVRGRDNGAALGTPIWDFNEDKDENRLVRVKPLLPEVTDILIDQNGNFVGLEQPADPAGVNVDGVVKSPVRIAAPFKAWKYTYDSECDYHWGRSWLENVRRTAWADWLDCAQQLQKLGAKISGVFSVIISPAGTFQGQDASGNPKQISYQENAEKVIKALAKGVAGVWFPSLSIQTDKNASVDILKMMAELSGKSATKVEVLDFGAQSPAILGILERMVHAEALMFAGGLQPSRVGLEGKHGTKAETEVMTDTGLTNAQNNDTDFSEQLQPLVDSILFLNKGKRAVGKVRVKSPSLRRPAVLNSLLTASMNNQVVTQALFEILDVDQILLDQDIPTKGAWDPKRVEALTEKAGKGNADKGPVEQPNPSGGKPKKKKGA